MLEKLSCFQNSYGLLRSGLLEAFSEIEQQMHGQITPIGASSSFVPGFVCQLLECYDEVAQLHDKDEISVIEAMENFFSQGKIEQILIKAKETILHSLLEGPIKLLPHDPFFYQVDAYSVINWGLMEVPHTKMLAFFLDPTREHNLMLFPLKAFLKTINRRLSNGPSSDLGVFNYDSIVWKTDYFGVIPEKPIPGGGRIDLVLTINPCALSKKTIFAFEGKVMADFSDYQLKDYGEWLLAQRDAELYLMTLTKDEVDKEEWKDVDPSISHGEIFWIDVARSFCALLYDSDFQNWIDKNPIAEQGSELLRLWISTLLGPVCNIIGRPTYSQMKSEPNSISLRHLLALNEHLAAIQENLRGEP